MTKWEGMSVQADANSLFPKLLFNSNTETNRWKENVFASVRVYMAHPEPPNSSMPFSPAALAMLSLPPPLTALHLPSLSFAPELSSLD